MAESSDGPPAGQREDLAELLRAGEALRESEERLRFAVDASGMGVWSYEVATDTLEVDPRLAAITGVPAGRHALAELAARVPLEDRRAVLSAVRSCVETGIFPDVEHRVLRQDRPPAWVHTKGRALRNASGVVTRIVGGSFDVTAQVDEAERREQTQKLQAVGQLAAGVAHNFNNALASMQLNLEVGLRRCPEDVQPLLRDALEVGQRAAKLVRELLHFAGRGARRDVRELEGLDQLALRVASLCRQTFPAAITLETSCAPELPRLPLAVAQVEQLVLNLLINAQHALEDVEREHPWVRVGVVMVAGEDADGRREDVPATCSCLRLRVEDNGCGMGVDTVARIFEPFFSTKEPGRGAGLGLATVYSTARDHGGWVTCSSRSGEGTAFSVYFPIRGRVIEADDPSPLP